MSSTSQTFVRIDDSDPIKKVLQTAFSVELPIEGGWGYEQESATILKERSASPAQMAFMLASMRTQIEMNLTLQTHERYGAINLKPQSVQTQTGDTLTYEKHTFEVSAIKEETYHTLIQEYKENYGKEDFDLDAHFEKREKATLKRTITYWIAY